MRIAVEPFVQNPLVIDAETVGVADTVEQQVHHVPGRLFERGGVQTEGAAGDSAVGLRVTVRVHHHSGHVFQRTEQIRLAGRVGAEEACHGNGLPVRAGRPIRVVGGVKLEFLLFPDRAMIRHSEVQQHVSPPPGDSVGPCASESRVQEAGNLLQGIPAVAGGDSTRTGAEAGEGTGPPDLGPGPDEALSSPDPRAGRTPRSPADPASPDPRTAPKDAPAAPSASAPGCAPTSPPYARR